MNYFALWIEELGELLGIPLVLDRHDRCVLSIDSQLEIHITQEEQPHRLRLATFLGEVPPGVFGERVFREALKENHRTTRLGTLSYSPRNHQLALVSYLSSMEMNGERLADSLHSFIEKAFSWKRGIETGSFPAHPSAAIEGE